MPQTLSRTIEDQLRRMTPVSAPPEQKAEVAALYRFFDEAETRTASIECRLVGPRDEVIRLPDAMFYVLKRVVELLARGDAISIVPVGKEMTTQQAANLLNVSRQYLVRLLDEGKIPFTKTGKHRRLKIEDVLTFKEKRDRERKENLDTLTRISEEYGGYDELK